MNAKELRAKAAQLFKDAQALMKKETITAEDRTAFDKMIAEAGTAEADAERMESVDAKIEKYTRGNAPPREQPGAGAGAGEGENNEAAQLKEQRTKFTRFIRYGEVYKETRDLGTVTAGAITGGAQFIPQAFYPVLTEAQKAWGGIVNILNQKETENGAPMKMAFSNDTGNLLHEPGEPASLVETDPTLTSLIMSTDMFDTGIVKVTVQELQDTYFDIDAFIRDNFGKRYYRGLVAKITNGSTGGNVVSIVTGATLGATSAGGSAITYADLVNLYAALDPAYVEAASWSMNSATRGVLLRVTDTLGRPLFIPDPSGGPFDRLLGRPVVLNQSLDNVAPSTSSPAYTGVAVQFGDFKQGYLLRTVKPGLAIVRLNERFMDTLEIGFIGYVRAGGTPTDAGTHPLLNLVQHT